MSTFDHERLDVYQAAIDFVAAADQIVEARFYRMAARSATECAAILDVCKRLTLAEAGQLAESRNLLLRIVAMLTRMSQKLG